jgi:ribulose-phosphate 3-epimerase
VETKIAPSILAADFTRLGEQIHETQNADWLHIDIMDGRFVHNISFGPMMIAAAKRASSLPLDVHLMIEEPEKHLQACKDAGANHVTVHVEACPNLHRTLQQIKALDMKAGVALNPHTPAVMIRHVLSLLDEVLVMTVNPGAGGQIFLPEMLPKIREIRQLVPELPIIVDGGIDADTIKAAHTAGASVFVAGSSVFKHESGIAGGIAALREAIK